MKNGVERIFPSLIGETVFVGTGIFNEAVAILVGRSIDPSQRRFDRRPQLI
jgi:hypothetical protein